MPILADVLVETLKDDEPRYLQMIESGELVYDRKIVAMARVYQLYVGVDRYVESLSNCRLVVLLKDGECVYSCYYKVAHSPYFGNRVVQTEVRQAPGRPGIARSMMKNYFLKDYDCIRTDLGSTTQGMKMWQTFYDDFRHELFFYKAQVNIDLRTSDGLSNQDASYTEVARRVGRIRLGRLHPNWWHDNKAGNVCVIYASNNPM